MDLKELMSTTPEGLADLQYRELKTFALAKLNRIVESLSQGYLGVIRDELVESPAGDECGTDHYFINFNFGDDPVDLAEILDRLEELNRLRTIKEGQHD